MDENIHYRIVEQLQQLLKGNSKKRIPNELLATRLTRVWMCAYLVRCSQEKLLRRGDKKIHPFRSNEIVSMDAVVKFCLYHFRLQIPVCLVRQQVNH